MASIWKRDTPDTNGSASEEATQVIPATSTEETVEHPVVPPLPLPLPPAVQVAEAAEALEAEASPEPVVEPVAVVAAAAEPEPVVVVVPVTDEAEPVSARDRLSESADQAKAKFGESADQAKAKFGEGAEHAKAKLGEGAEQAKVQGSKMRKRIAEAAADARDMASSAAAEARDRASNADVNEFAHSTTRLIDTARPFFLAGAAGIFAILGFLEGDSGTAQIFAIGALLFVVGAAFSGEINAVLHSRVKSPPAPDAQVPTSAPPAPSAARPPRDE